MIILYPLKAQSDYTELMYSLRSVEKYIRGVDEIVIIGDRLPDWITNVTWINMGDVSGRKQYSIRRKILAGLEYAKRGLFMNDDIYFTTPVNTLQHYPYYYWGTLERSQESGARPLMNQLQAMGKPIKNFDSNSHYPIIYDERFKTISENFTEDCIIKSMYCNYLNIEGFDTWDSKITNSIIPLASIRNFIEQRHCFSTGANSLKSVLPVLQEMFPVKSRYEL